MTKKIIISEKLPATGPYSTAVEAGGLIFLSGQLPVDPASGKIVTDIAGATRQCLQNIKTVLENNGCSMADIIKTTIFVKNMEYFPEVNSAYAEFFPAEPPARSTIGVAALPKDAIVEIEAVAIRK